MCIWILVKFQFVEEWKVEIDMQFQQTSQVIHL